MTENKRIMGLVKGRHEIDGVEDYIFDSVTDVFDLDSHRETVYSRLKGVKDLDLYVTGLTITLVEVINYAILNDMPLTLYHYDRETGEYRKQKVLTDYYREAHEIMGIY